ncbi:MAG: leucyl/phenylalanyl-tRNA--protein transferase [Pseudomonadota bacterium]
MFATTHSAMRDDVLLTPELLLRAYQAGIFPMSEARHSETLFWVDPERRGVIPLDGLHISRSLRRDIRRADYEMRINTDFSGVLEGCANRAETWINEELQHLYHRLYAARRAHSMEIWQDGRLAGGIFGVAIGGAFFGESMFSARTNASKIAMVYLVDRLRETGFELFDTQFLTDHLASLGAVEITRGDYRDVLAGALRLNGDFTRDFGSVAPQDVLQRMTQTS